MSTAFYVGSRPGAVTRFEAGAGRLRATDTVDVGGGVATMALDHASGRLYVAVNDGPSIVVLDTRAQLARVAEIPLPVPLAYLSHAGGRLFGASYGDDVIVSIGGDDVQVVAVGSHPHCVIADPYAAPDDAAVWVSVLGDDVLLRIPLDDGRFDPGRMTRVPTPSAFGPRHIVASPTTRELFVIGERSAGIARVSAGERRVVDVWSTLPADTNLVPGIVRTTGDDNPDTDGAGHPLTWAADLAIDPSGRFLYSTERRTSTLSISSTTPGRLLRTLPTQLQPRGIGIRDSMLLATGELSDEVTLYLIDAHGDLTETSRAPVPLGALWIS